jgi:RNA polymerase sigma factor (sigma-70 family)
MASKKLGDHFGLRESNRTSYSGPKGTTQPMSKETLDRDDFIDRIRADDEKAQIALFEYGRTYLLGINIDPPRGLFREDSEDIVEEVCITILKNGCPSYKKSKGPFTHYFARTVTVAGRYYLRQRRRRQKAGYSRENISGEPEGGDLGKYLELLSEKNRAALALWFGEELSVDVIAGKLGISQPAVRMRIFRGIEDLKKKLKGSDPRELQRQPRATEQRNRSRA